ncbi:DUF4041 domain-containing protein [Staphylococcus pseudintermedius]
MDNKKLIIKWLPCTILITSFFSIVSPGLGLIPFGFSIYMIAKFLVVDKSIEMDVSTLQKLKDKKIELKNENQELLNTNEKVAEKIEAATKELDYLIEQLDDTIEKYEVKMTYPFEMIDVDSFEIMSQIKKLELKEKDLLSRENVSIFVSDSNKRHHNSQAKQIIRLFNAESSILINKVTHKNVETLQNKLFQAYQTLNKLFETDNVAIPSTVLDIKLEQLQLVHQYQVKLEDEKEIRKEEKARIQEEKKVERELERKLKDIDKDIKHHNNEVSKLTTYLSKANTDVEKEIFAEKIRELEKQILKLKSDKDSVNERMVKAQSGYVYVISNIGSFGENIYKIGVTRRLEPLDRIKELGDASVPFEFDVHALIFSENEFDLEKKLHDHFKDNQVNKVNNRKEFYNVDLKEIERIVLDEYNETVKFVHEPKAEQYRESISLSS